MECVEGAFKPNFMGIKFNHLPPSFSDDFWAVNGVSGDDFFVDEFLDFSTDAGFVEEDDNSQVLKLIDDTNNKPSTVTPVKTENQHKAIVSETELSLPVNDVTELEWVSKFVDDSFSGDYSLISPAKKFPETGTETVTLVAVNPSFKNLVHKRARSKRSRTGGRVWSLRSTSTLPDSSTSCSYSSNPQLTAEETLRGPPVQRKMKKRSVEMAGIGVSGQRRCSHCLVQKTPQWRAGPLGAKTLCNACGVRFKSGRLLPEYRPACSPTFSNEVHSNNHRKVMEMRRKKEEAEGGGVSVSFHGS